LKSSFAGAARVEMSGLAAGRPVGSLGASFEQAPTPRASTQANRLGGMDLGGVFIVLLAFGLARGTLSIPGAMSGR
jgi:hypothetical protein